MTQPFLLGDGWIEVRDGDDSAREMFERHYSSQRNLIRRRARRTKLIVGPGFKLVLIRADAASVCAWRREKHRADGQRGVECVVYRREDGELASDMLREAMTIAWARWPGERLFTFVDPLGVQPTIRASRPTWGHVFYLAGWRFYGVSKKRLHILEATP